MTTRLLAGLATVAIALTFALTACGSAPAPTHQAVPARPAAAQPAATTGAPGAATSPSPAAAAFGKVETWGDGLRVQVAAPVPYVCSSTDNCGGLVHPVAVTVTVTNGTGAPYSMSQFGETSALLDGQSVSFADAGNQGPTVLPGHAYSWTDVFNLPTGSGDLQLEYGSFGRTPALFVGIV